jgi:hypothetical protein
MEVKKSLLTLDEIVKVYQSLDEEEIGVFPTKWRNIEHMEHMVCLRCDSASLDMWVQSGKDDCKTSDDFKILRFISCIPEKVFDPNTSIPKMVQ